MNGLRNFIDDDLTQLVDTKDVVGTTQVALDLLTVFFNVGMYFFFTSYRSHECNSLCTIHY
jgi:hypothetical protein